jgi:hypothetical protein
MLCRTLMKKPVIYSRTEYVDELTQLRQAKPLQLIELQSLAWMSNGSA